MADPLFFEALFGAVHRLPGDGLIIDLGIALVFFTALSFAVLGPRFAHQRSAAAMSAALGMALSTGLVAWEVRSGLRLADLGPIAAGLGLIMIALVIYQAVKRVGGQWAGVFTALGAALLIGQVLAVPGLQIILQGVLGPLAALGLIAAGAATLAMRTRGSVQGVSNASGKETFWPPSTPSTTISREEALQDKNEPVRDAAEQVHAIDDVQRINHRLDEHLALATNNAKMLPAQPELAALLRRQLSAVLPESQAVTRRLADLRAKTQMLRQGHIAKIRRLAPQIPKLPPDAARVASEQLREAYKEARLEERIDRLDRAAIHAEQQIDEVITTVNRLLDAGRYDQAAKVLHDTEKLARQVQRLIKQIEKDEQKVLALAVKATRAQRQRKQVA
ncbi:MAG: hypothetical protein ACE37H_07950 [Phycisphaeraceae bacterium]